MLKKTIRNNLVRIVAYSMTMVLLGYGYFEAAAEGEENIVIQEDPVATSAYTNVWRTGCYSAETGAYEEVNGRACHISYDEVTCGGTYKAVVTMPGIHMLIRELDANYGMIRTDDLVNDQEVILDANAQYVGVSLYAPGNAEMPFGDFITMFESGMSADFVFVSAPEEIVMEEIGTLDPYVPAEEGSDLLTIEETVEEVTAETKDEASIEKIDESVLSEEIETSSTRESDSNQSFEQIWRTGCYEYGTGNYISFSSRICHVSLDEAEAGADYVANISDSKFHLLVREFNENQKYITSHEVKAGGVVTLSGKTKYIAVSLYNPRNTNITYEQYKELFANGFYANITKVDTLDVSQDAQAVLSVETVSQPKSEFENEWKSGCYSYGTGMYSQDTSRICHVSLDEVKSGATYVATISDSNFHLLVRELNENQGYITSHELKNGSTVTVTNKTKYIAVSLYNPRNTNITYEQYKDKFANGFVATLSMESEAGTTQVDTTKGSVTNEDSEFVKTWKTGYYAYGTGVYTQDSSKICHVSIEQVEAGSVYVASISDTKYRLLVRELNANQGYVTSHELKNGGTVTLSSKTKYIAVSLYTPYTSNITYDQYKELFANGFTAVLTKSGETIPNKAADTSVSQINPEFAKIWRSGGYDYSTGKYVEKEGYICHLDYEQVEAGAQYKANISVKGYNILVRQFDSNMKRISSSNLTDGQIVTMGSTTKYVGVSVYCPSNSKVTYEQYSTMFVDGFNPTLTKVESSIVVDEDPIELVIPAKGSYSAAPIVSNPQTIRDELKNMILTGDASSHNVSKYNMTYQEIQKVWDDLAANECYLAVKTYASAFLQVTKNSSNIVQTVSIYSADADFVNRYIRVQQVVSDFVAYTSGMSQLEKALAAHEYIVSHTTYTKTGDLRQYSGGYVLGDGKGVCEAYSSAYEILLHEVGMTVYRVSSDSMNHAWSAVLIDGLYYMVDNTWDNTRQGSNGYNSHRYFIRTDAEFNNLSHYSWKCYQNAGLKCTNTKYSSWFVHDVCGQMYYYGGYWYYWDNSTNCIVKSTISGSNRSVVIDGNGHGTLKVTGISNGVLSYTVSGKSYTKSLK